MPAELAPRLRSFLEALAADRSPSAADLDALNALAARALGEEHEDAAADFIVTTLEATRAGGRSASATLLLDLPDRELVAVVRHRLRQKAQQRLPRRRLFRAIRAHVADALCRPSTGTETISPVSLLKGERLCCESVGAATDHVLATEPGTPRSASIIAARLMTAYFSTAEHEESSTDVQLGLDAATVAAEFRAALDPELLRVVKHRSRGLALQEIAQLEGVATSTVHARVRQAVLWLRRHATLAGVDIETGRTVMAMLGA